MKLDFAKSRATIAAERMSVQKAISEVVGEEEAERLIELSEMLRESEHELVEPSELDDARRETAGDPCGTPQVRRTHLGEREEVQTGPMHVGPMSHQPPGWVPSGIQLVADGADRFRVPVPVVLDDGDHPVVILKREGTRWVLSDEGHTRMRLAHDADDTTDWGPGLDREAIANIPYLYGIMDWDGELVLVVIEERFGDDLRSFVRALLEILGIDTRNGDAR